MNLIIVFGNANCNYVCVASLEHVTITDRSSNKITYRNCKIYTNNASITNKYADLPPHTEIIHNVHFKLPIVLEKIPTPATIMHTTSSLIPNTHNMTTQLITYTFEQHTNTNKSLISHAVKQYFTLHGFPEFKFAKPKKTKTKHTDALILELLGDAILTKSERKLLGL
jgi:hypothetical protein